MFSIVSDRDKLGFVSRYRTAIAAGIVKTTSYDNPGGTGDRSAVITVSSSGGWYRVSGLSTLVNGITNSNVGLNSVSALGCTLVFDFGTIRTVNELKFYSYSGYTYGTWCVLGSNDNSTWSSALSANIEISGNSSPTIFTFPISSYRYLKLEGVSGTVDGNGYFHEVEFGIDDNT